MSSSNRTTSRGGKGPKTDKAHKSEKSDTSKTSGDKQQLSGGGGGGDNTIKTDEQKIKQIIEMTRRPEPQVCLALHECDYDMERAVEMLLDLEDEEWETTVKKKKNRQTSTSKSEQKSDGAAQGGTGDEWNETPSHPSGGEKDKPRNKTGGPQRLHGRHNDSRGWRGREKQENERNLEDGGPGRDRDRRGRGATRGTGRGRGGGRAGGRYPQRSNRGGGSFNSNRPMETWDNSNTWDNNTVNHTVEENWDEFPGADEWCGTLAETKVFTPSQPPENITEPEPKPGTTPVDNSTSLSSSVQQSMDMLAQIQAAQNSPVPMGGALNAAQTQYFSQLTQQNASSDMSKYSAQSQQQPSSVQQNAYGNSQQFPSQQPSSAYNSGTAYAAAAYGTTGQETVTVQQPPARTKTQRARVPPPSKIPASAVEMPGDLNSSIGFLDLQFGAMDMMSDSSSFDGVSDPKYQNAPPLENNITSTNMDLSGQGQNTTAAMDAYSPPKPNAQSSISSALSQGLSNSDTIPQTSEHIAGGYNSTTVSTQRTPSGGVSSSAPANANSTGLDQLSKQTESHSYSQASTYSTYQPKSTYQNQTYSSSSNYSGTQTTSSYVSNQGNNSYVNSDSGSYNSQSANSTYQNAYSSNSSYQANANSGSFPSISQANSYPSNNQAYQQNTSQSVYGANTGLNNSSNYNSNSAAQYNSYNSNHKLVKDSTGGSAGGYDSSAVVTSSVSSTSASTSSSLALTQTTASATKANTTLAKNSSGVMSNMPPSPAVMSTQYIMGQVPYFQPPIYSYEDMQMLQQRIPHMTTPFYEMSYQTPTTTLRDGSYSLSDGRFTRTDSNASPVPSTQTSTQPMLAAQTTGPYFFTPYNPLQPGYQFGPVYTSQLQPGTNAHGSSNSAQYPKQATYGSGYTSGYDTLSQSQDYNKGGYVGNTQGQNKATSGNASSTGNAPNDITGMYGKAHTALGKVNSYEKQGFHSGTPPPFTGALGQSALAPSGTGYGPQMYIPTMPQHHSTPLMHQPLHQMEVRHQGRRMDSGNSSGQRTQANNQPKTGAKQGYPTASYWNQS